MKKTEGEPMSTFTDWERKELTRNSRAYKRVTVYGVVIAVLAVIGAAVYGDMQWSRLKGKVKGINGKASTITIQNAEGDLFTVKVDADVEIVVGKEVRALRDVSIDDKVTLVNIPLPPVQKGDDEPADGGVYAPLKR